MNDSQTPPQEHAKVDREAFRKRIAFVQDRSGMNKGDFARSIGTTHSNFSQVLQGQRMLTVDQIYALFVVHGVPMEYTIAGQIANLPHKYR